MNPLQRFLSHCRNRIGQTQLPTHCYPPRLNKQQRLQFDKTLLSNVNKLPNKTGVYQDRDGDLWKLDSKGRWTDHHGTTMPARYSLHLVAALPLTPLAKETL